MYFRILTNACMAFRILGSACALTYLLPCTCFASTCQACFSIFLTAESALYPSSFHPPLLADPPLQPPLRFRCSSSLCKSCVSVSMCYGMPPLRLRDIQYTPREIYLRPAFRVRLLVECLPTIQPNLFLDILTGFVDPVEFSGHTPGYQSW